MFPVGLWESVLQHGAEVYCAVHFLFLCGFATPLCPTLALSSSKLASLFQEGHQKLAADLFPENSLVLLHLIASSDEGGVE